MEVKPQTLFGSRELLYLVREIEMDGTNLCTIFYQFWFHGKATWTK